MDFTSQYTQFPAGQAYQQFMPVPPLTPSHSHSANSDDFNPSPSDAFDASMSHTDQFQGLDFGAQGFNNHHTGQNFSGPPTPPNNNGIYGHNQNHQGLQQQPQHQSSQSFHQPTGQDVHTSSAMNGHANGVDITKSEPGLDEFTGQAGSGDGDGEDDESLTPAQSRRKAQNRAAQRAFRERKEKHVKDLEAKLADMEAAQQQSSIENERLKRDLHKMSTENEILRATSSSRNSHKHHSSYSPEPVMTTGPMQYSPTDFYSNVLEKHPNKFPSHRIVTGDDGEKLLAAGATWDYIISHDQFKRGLVNVADVSERLKDKARCDGQGPVFAEKDIINAIEQSVANGSDDLI